MNGYGSSIEMFMIVVEYGFLNIESCKCLTEWGQNVQPCPKVVGAGVGRFAATFHGNGQGKRLVYSRLRGGGRLRRLGGGGSSAVVNLKRGETRSS